MKHLLLLLMFSFFFISNTYTQLLLEVGAEWKYQIIYEFGIPIKKDVVKLVVVKDTILFGKSVQKLQVFKNPTLDINTEIFISNENQRVYYWEGLSQYLLYDFSLNKGDKYILRFPSGLSLPLPLKLTAEISIDSTNLINYNGKNLKVQYLSSKLQAFTIGKIATEGIGFDSFLLPTYDYPNSESNIFTNKMCFSYKNISIPPNGCNITNSLELSQQLQLVSAAVFNNDIVVNCSDNHCKKGIFNLYDTQGNLAATYSLLQNHDEYRFDISNLANGMYFWHLVLDDKTRQSGKVVVIKE
jgi:hypothetical protein